MMGSKIVAATAARENVAEREHSAPQATSPLLWLSMTCLDAPIVAVTWQWLFAQTFHARIPAAHRVVLFLSAWLIYLGDRLTDSLTIPSNRPTSARQRFCLQHRKRMIILLALIAIVNAPAGLLTLDRHTLFSGAIVGSAIGIYLVINHLSAFIWTRVPLKEVSIGVLFALGVVSAIAVGGLTFTAALSFFAILCSLNCLNISVWERTLDRVQDRVTFATAFPRLRKLPEMGSWLLAFGALPFVFHSSLRMFALCVAGSAAALGILNRADSIRLDARVALADLVLLTPLLFCHI